VQQLQLADNNACSSCSQWGKLGESKFAFSIVELAVTMMFAVAVTTMLLTLNKRKKMQ
jgi:hypothetical protein